MKEISQSFIRENVMDYRLSERKVCANCIYRYSENKNLGYDHYDPSKCKKNDGKCSDIWNTVCDDFERR